MQGNILIHQITGGVQHEVTTGSRGDRVAHRRIPGGTEFSIAYAQVHRGIQHHGILRSRGTEQQVLREIQIRIVLRHIAVAVVIPVLVILHPGQIAPGTQAVLQADMRGQHIALGILDFTGIEGGAVGAVALGAHHLIHGIQINGIPAIHCGYG